MKFSQFMGLCIEDLVSENVTIQFNHRKNDSKSSFSFFNSSRANRPMFVVNYFSNSIEEVNVIFLHEYCHFLQWKTHSKIYDDAMESWKIYAAWLRHARTTIDIEHLRNIQRLELDCDKRAVKLIKKHDLDIDIEEYIRESNSYILGHNYMHERRTFFKTWALIPEVLSLVPKRHLKESELSISIPEHKRLFYENCKF